MNWSIAVVYVDLVKAFDRLVRELVMGWPEDGKSRDDRVAYLVGLGVAQEVAIEIVDTVEREGCAFAQMGAPDSVTQLARSLHSGAWFVVDASGRYLVARRGGGKGVASARYFFTQATR